MVLEQLEAMQVVWFKKDLRVADHRPLFEAAKSGPCLCVYIYEPEILQSPEFDSSHLGFINQSLQELRHSLHALGGRLILRVGEATAGVLGGPSEHDVGLAQLGVFPF